MENNFESASLQPSDARLLEWARQQAAENRQLLADLHDVLEEIIANRVGQGKTQRAMDHTRRRIAYYDSIIEALSNGIASTDPSFPKVANA